MDSDETAPRVYWTAAGATDIGGSRENQDDFFIWENRAEGIFVMGVLDGHGREVGKVAAQSGRAAFQRYFDEHFHELIADPVGCLHQSFLMAHAAIKAEFRAHFERMGFEVSESEDGFLMKKKSTTPTWSCVHGGTSCSLIAKVGDFLYSANVGDSSVTLCTGTPIATTGIVEDIIDTAVASADSGAVVVPEVITDVVAEAAPLKSGAIVVTAEHSPECPLEFYRLRNFRKRDSDGLQSALYVVYDSPSIEKVLCPPVFFIDSAGTATVTNRGRYYKNVRNEWASLVATPPTAQFQDALAFTRSLGDFHLQTYGVSHLPMIRRISLRKLFVRLEDETSARFPVLASVSPMPCSYLACVVISTDGIWDNWTYEDITKFVMDDSCTKAVLQTPPKYWGGPTPEIPEASDAPSSPTKPLPTDAISSSPSLSGSQRVANSLIKRNAIFARRNFGNDADNATGIVLYLARDPTGPAEGSEATGAELG